MSPRPASLSTDNSRAGRLGFLSAALGLALVPATLLPTTLLGQSGSAPDKAAAAPPPALVDVRPIESRQFAEGQSFVGTVIPLKRATVGSAVAGRVSEVHVEVGDRVEAMHPLAQLLTETISLEHQSAEAELQLRKQLLAELQNGSLPEEIEQARAAMDAAQARSEYLEARMARLQQLAGTRSVTAEELGEALATTQEASAAYRQAKATFELAQQGPRQEKIAQAQASVDVQQALVGRLADMLKKHTMISRFDGYVVAKHVEIGGWVNQGDPVADVVALDVVEIQAYVLENYVPYVRLGQTARVEVPALPGKTFLGEVSAVSAQADARSRTFEVRVRVTNEFEGDLPVIKAGMMARVVLPTGPEVEATMVPKDAITLGGAQPTLWVVDPQSIGPHEENGASYRKGIARPVAVRLGAADGDWIQAIGTLEPGSYVVVEGNERLVSRQGQGVPVMWSAAADPVATDAAANDAKAPSSRGERGT